MSANKKPALAAGFRERMMGLEPTTFCMASVSGRQWRPTATYADAFLKGFFVQAGQ
jgi:hypothetical protein